MNTSSTVTITADNFVIGYERTLNEQAAGIARLHLQQFIQNFEHAFGHTPTRHQLDGAFRFLEMFIQELNDIYPGQYSNSPTRLQLLLCQDPVAIAESLARFAAPPDPAPTAAEYFLP